MNKETVDEKIVQAAKVIFSYCITRTNSKEEAEDLSQEIMFELLRSKGNIRDEKAFYGFMWAVAGNVYKNWCKKRAEREFSELDENVPNVTFEIDEGLEKESDVKLLFRELCLLSEKYRKATVLYYFNGLAVSEISKQLHISVSMVKYLLFKARQILKEGMKMERNYGEQSYNPRNMSLRFWGTGSNCFWKLCDGNLIAQNILLACYNDSCTVAEISLQLGIPIPYLERDIEKLCEYGVLNKTGERYFTNAIIFTKDFSIETDTKVLLFVQEIANLICKFINENEKKIRNIGFHGKNMSGNLFKWHITGIMLEKAVFSKFQDSLNIKYPKTIFGDDAFVWGEEDYTATYGGFGTCSLCNKAGDLIRFLDFSINGEMLHHYFYNYPNRINALLDIAKGRTDKFSENDLEEVAGLIKRGLVGKINMGLSVNMPIFTKTQFDELLTLLDPITSEIANKTAVITQTAAEILVNHTPAHLVETAKSMGWLKMFDNAVVAPVKALMDNGYLHPVLHTEIPTSYIVLV